MFGQVRKPLIRGRGLYHSGPAPVVSSVFSHHICAFFVVVPPSHLIPFSRRHDRGSIQRYVSLQTILDLLRWGRFYSFFVRTADRFNGTMLVICVSCQQHSIVRTFVVILRAYSIQYVDTISARNMFLTQMRRAMCFLGLVAEGIERPIGGIAWVSRGKGIFPIAASPVRRCASASGRRDLCRCLANRISGRGEFLFKPALLRTDRFRRAGIGVAAGDARFSNID